MVTPEMVPDEVVKAASREYELYIYDAVSEDGIRLAIASALNAWPGVCKYEPDILDPVVNPARIILPLKEQTNED